MKRFTQFIVDHKTTPATNQVDGVSDKEFAKLVKQFQWTYAEKSSLKKLQKSLATGFKGPGSVLVYKAQHNMKFRNIEESEFSIMTAEQWKSFDHKNLEIGGVDVQNGSTHHESTYSTVLLARYNGVNEEVTNDTPEIAEARFKTWQRGAMPRQDQATPEEIRVIAREKEMKSRRAAENNAKTHQEGTNYDQWYERNQIFKKLKKDGELQKMVQKRGDQTSAINRALKDHQAEKKSPKK